MAEHSPIPSSEIVPATPQIGPGRGSCLAVGLIAAGLLFIFCLGIAAIVVRGLNSVSKQQAPPAAKTAPPASARTRSRSRRSAPTVPAAEDERAAAREARSARQRVLAETRAGFAATAVGADAATLAGVEQVLDAFIAASKSQPPRPLSEPTFSPDLFLRAMMAGPTGAQLENFARFDLRKQIEEGALVPHGWVRYHIVSVGAPDSAGAAIVCAHLFHDTDYSNPLRFWITREGNQWKLADWEQVEFGLRESQRWAINATADSNGGFRQLAQEIAQASELIEQRKPDDAYKVLSKAAEREFAHPRRDEWRVRQANVWMEGGWNDEALAACRQIQQRELVPALYLTEARAQTALGRRMKALALLDRYEQLVGPMPQADGERLPILERLHRRDEAAKVCMRQLKLSPESMETMQHLGRLLDQKQALADHVATLEDPLPVAVKLAETFAMYGDLDGLQCLTALVRQRDARHASLPRLAARAAELEGSHEQAAAAFLELLKAEPDKKQQAELSSLYLSCMVGADKAIAGYEAAPDAVAAFAFLTNSDEDEPLVHAADLARLVELHRRRAPQDPWGGYQAALLLLREKKYDAALDELRKAAALIPKDKSSDEAGAAAAIRYEQVVALHGAGRGMEAYQQIPPADETFNQLAGLYQGDESQTDALAKLVARHRAAHPKDARLDYYAAVVEIQRGRHAQAERLLQRAYRAAPEEYRKSQIAHLWLTCREKQGRLTNVWRGLGPPADMFAMLANRLEEQQAWPQLRQAIDEFTRHYPQNPQILMWSARWCSGTSDDAKLVALLDPWPAAANRLLPTERATLKDLLLRAYQRQGKREAAWALARKLADEEENLQPLILLSAAEGNVSQATDAMLRLDPQLYSRSALYNDASWGAALRSPALRPFRDRFPPDLPGAWPRNTVVLLLDELPANPAQALKPALAQWLGPDVALREVKDSAGVEFVTVAEGAKGRIVVAADRKPYLEPKIVADAQLKNKELLKRLQDHRAWLAIEVIRPQQEIEARKLCGQLAAGLVSEKCRAVWWEGRLAPADAAMKKRLAEGPWTGPASEAWGEQFWMAHAAPISAADRQWNVERERSLKTLDKAFAKGGDGEFLIQVQIESGHATIQPWLKLLRIENQGGSLRSLVCTAQDATALAPDLTVGEPVVVRSYEVHNWKHTSGGKTQFGRPEPQP